MKQLLEWNEKINLTSIKNENEFIVKHYIDSLTIVKEINEEDKVLDLSQGGFPNSGRSPKDEGRDTSCVNHLTQDSSCTHQVLLSYIIVQRLGAQTLCQRLCHDFAFLNYTDCKVKKILNDFCINAMTFFKNVLTNGRKRDEVSKTDHEKLFQ